MVLAGGGGHEGRHCREEEGGEQAAPRECEALCGEGGRGQCVLRVALLLPRSADYDACLPAVSMCVCVCVLHYGCYSVSVTVSTMCR